MKKKKRGGGAETAAEKKSYSMKHIHNTLKKTGLTHTLIALLKMQSGMCQGHIEYPEGSEERIFVTLGLYSTNFKAEAEAIKTGVEAIKTRAEAIKTGVEAIETGVEAIKTEAEAIKTGAEAIKTGVEAIKTEAANAQCSTDTSSSVVMMLCPPCIRLQKAKN